MAEIDKWRDYARMLGFPLPEEAEKDYLQDILLRNIYSIIGSELLFRGGTAISKIYSSGRFSEDLDFILNSAYESETASMIKKIEHGIKNINSYFQASYSKDVYKDMVNYTIKIDGPLYLSSSNDSAKQRISINLNTYERNLMPPQTSIRETPYPNLPHYTLISESQAELLADKIKAAIERRHKHKVVFARDIYDIWALATKYRLKPNFGIVSRKMELYGILKFSIKDFKACIDEAKEVWEEEMKAVVSTVPDYNEIKKNLKLLII